jgi:hypothetical protein
MARKPRPVIAIAAMKDGSMIAAYHFDEPAHVRKTKLSICRGWVVGMGNPKCCPDCDGTCRAPAGGSKARRSVPIENMKAPAW